VNARASTRWLGRVGVLIAVGGGCGNSTLDLFDPDRGLLGHWAFDEGAPGAVAVDSSSFGLDATPSADPPTPTRDVPPVHFPDPFSLSFNGTGQWVDVGNPPLLNAGGAISIAAWIRPANIDGYHNILAHGFRNNPNHEVSLRMYSGNYEITYWNSIDHRASAPIPASDVGSWVHLCGVFDGATYSIYRNGELAASTADATTPPANIDTPWAIGARAPQPDTAERLMAGQIDDLRFYGRALTAGEVEALYRR
jgi:hypothetical protein